MQRPKNEQRGSRAPSRARRLDCRHRGRNANASASCWTGSTHLDTAQDGRRSARSAKRVAEQRRDPVGTPGGVGRPSDADRRGGRHLTSARDRIFKDGRSAFAVPATTFRAAFENVDKYLGESTSSSIGMVDMKFSRRTSLVVGPPDGRIPTLTPEAQRRADAVDAGWRYKDRTGRPQQHSSMYHDRRASARWKFWRRTVQLLPDCADTRNVVLIMEAYHDARIIPLDGRPHLSKKIRQWNGDSRGHWEGDTLVDRHPKFFVQQLLPGAAEGMHLVERFTRTAPDTLTYEMSFSDPTTWATSWTAEMPLKRMDQSIYEFACHEGNHSLIGMLRTARLEDDR